MAKSKHSVALFEVIQAGRATRSGGGSLSTPKWWFKKRDKENAEAAAALTASAATATATLPPASDVPAVFEPQNIDTAPKSAGIARTAAVDLAVDPDRQRISFHFTYTSAIIVAFSVVVCVSLAYLVGQHMKQGPSTALAGPSIEQLKASVVKADVLNVGAAAAPTGNAKKLTPAAAAAGNFFEKSDVNKNTPTPVTAAAAAAPVAGTTSPSGERVRGLNYIIAQSWPEDEKQMAYDACEQLNKAGVLCTVEKNVPNYIMPGSSATYSVVTLHGYARISDPNYGAAEKAILSMNDKLGKTSKFKKLNPTGKKW